jgi:hypothetical protein
MKKSIVAIVLALASITTIFAKSIKDEIRSKAIETSTAMINGKYGTVADLTYPKLVELLGGREKIISMMEEGSAVGVKFVSVEVGQPTEPRRNGDKLFSVVPTHTTLQGIKQIIQESYLLAISTDNGASWTFLEGAGITPKRLSTFLLELPSGFELPKRPSARVVEPNK